MSSFESNTSSDMKSISISLKEESKSFSFEKISENEKNLKFCRCIFCFRIPLIYIKNSLIYLKCLNCPDVYSIRKINNYIYRDLINYKEWFRMNNFDNGYFYDGEFYLNEIKGKKILPISNIDNYCEEHFLKYYYFCETCQSNLCLDCKNYHNGHSIKYLNDYKLSSKEIEEIEKCIFQTNEFLDSNIDILKVIKQNLRNRLINVLDYLELYRNCLNKEQINELINKIPNNIHDFENFPNDFNNYISNVINIINENNLKNINYENNLIEEFQDKIIEKFELFEKEISNVENKISEYFYLNKMFIIIIQNIIDIYKLKENNLNYQIIKNLVNIRDNLQNLINNKNIITEFEGFKYYINGFLNGKYILNSYKKIENIFSKKLLSINIWSLKEFPIISSIENTSLLYNISIRDIIIINWIKNKSQFNDKIILYQRK